jgi:D-alanyl-lipoteichoic acid acyltransferase DltB (MBOAT superfamily)
MLFNSFHFLVFFPVVTVVYFFLPHRARVIWLLSASCYFYMAFVPKYLLILAGTILVDYGAGLLIAQAQGTRRKLFLIVSIAANCGVLAFFKYFNFLSMNVAALARAIHWNYSPLLLNWILPLGLSFHTLQAMSYTIEVYRGKQLPERRFAHFALYVMFYPQLVAGPIERPQNLLHQFDDQQAFDYRRVTDGLKLMAWGFFQKVVIADRLAVTVNMVYDHPAAHGGFAVLIAAWFFAFQILCDFSGYSDIARGAAQVMGFHLMINFRQPYWAPSIAELWRRWHISLSTWFRDYIYFPLGGRQVSLARHCRNILLVFLLAGLWHGANWTFVFWGGLYGVVMCASILWAAAFSNPEKRAGSGNHQWLSVFLTFNIAALAMVFFRAATLTQALYLLGQLRNLLSPAAAIAFVKEIGPWRLAAGGLLICFLQTVHWFQERYGLREMVNRQAAWLRWSVYFAGLMVIVAAGDFDASQKFIYFQF